MISNTFIKYGIIGVFNTFIGYGLTFYLFYINILPELANFVGYFVGFFASYFLNKRFNFKSTNSHKKEMPKFILSMAIAYGVNLVIFLISYRYFNINIYISQIIAGIVYVLVGYIMSKIWVFKE